MSSFDSLRPAGTYSGPVTAATPGQAPEVYRRWLSVGQPKNWHGPSDSLIEELWREKSDEQKEFWRSLAAQDARPAPAVTVEALEAALTDREILVNRVHGQPGEIVWRATPLRPHALAVQLLSSVDMRLTDDPPPEPKPAPELAAAMAETREVRDGYARLCKEFGDHSQSGQSARISLTVLNRHRKAAGLPGLRPAPAGERHDAFMQMREKLDAVGELATSMHREADNLAKTSLPGDILSAQERHYAAARIRQLLGPEAS